MKRDVELSGEFEAKSFAISRTLAAPHGEAAVVS